MGLLFIARNRKRTLHVVSIKRCAFKFYDQFVIPLLVEVFIKVTNVLVAILVENSAPISVY